MMNLINWLIANSAVVVPATGLLLYAIVNEAVCLNPNLKSNSIVQVLLPFLQKYNPQQPPSAQSK